MLSSDDDDVDFADNDNDDGYDDSDILHRPEHRPSLRRAHGEKAIKRSKNFTKSLQCVSLFASIGALPGFNLSNADLRIAQLLIAFCSAGGNYYKRTAHFPDSEFSYRIFTTDF